MDNDILQQPEIKVKDNELKKGVGSVLVIISFSLNFKNVLYFLNLNYFHTNFLRNGNEIIHINNSLIWRNRPCLR